MTKLKLFGATFVLTLAFFMPASSHAYETVDQAAYQLNEDTYLFMVSYEFGYLNASAELSVAAMRGAGQSAAEPTVAYEIETAAGEVTHGGMAAAVVLSDAPIVDGTYQVNARDRKVFTLLVLYQTDAAMEVDDSLAMQITKLTNVVERQNEERSLISLSTAELASYRAELGN